MVWVASLTFGSLLKRYRRAAGLTQEALAARAGYSATYISMLERGERVPTRATVELLCQALRLTRTDRASLLSSISRRSRTLTQGEPERSAMPPILGRAQELGMIVGHLEGEGTSMLCLAGEPGIGKTRLLREAARMAPAAGWAVLEGGCHRSGGQQPYAPLLGALEQYIQRQRIGQLRATLSDCSWMVRLLPELAETTLVPLPQGNLPPIQERRLMFAAVGRFLANIAGPKGTLLILDDLQWADADALELLATLLRQPCRRPLHVIGAYRSTEVHAGDALDAMLLDLGHEGLAARCDLGPLRQDEAAALLDKQLGPLMGKEVDLARRLLWRSGGVPFFLISLAQGVASRAQDGSTSEQIPADVAESVLQRLALLPAAAQDLLTVAAVLGRRVHGDVLAVASDLTEDERIASLEELCWACLLVEEGDDAYRFAHDLIREVLEAALSTARRRMLHRRVAEALEQRSGAPVEQLAYHYLRSDRLGKALTYSLLAAEQAETRHAHTEAEEYYRSAIALAGKLGDRLHEATALEQLGVLLDVMANMRQAREVLEQAIKSYQAAGDHEGLRRSLARLARVYYASGMPPEVGLALLEPFLPSLLDGEVSAGRAMLHIALARLYGATDRFTEQLAEAERARESANTLGNASLEAEAEHRRSIAFSALGQPDESLRVAEQALSLAQGIGDLWQECFLLTDIDSAYLRLGMMRQSEAAAVRAVELAKRLGMPGPLTYALCLRSDVAFHLGDWQRARDDVEQAMGLVRPLETYWIAATPRMLLGRLCLAEGQWDSGRRYVEEGMALADSMHESPNSIGASVAIGRVAIAETDLLSGRANLVITDLEPVLDGLAGATGGRLTMLPCLAWAYLDTGDSDRAAELLADGIAHAQSQLYQLALMDGLLVRARVEVCQQRWTEAQSTLDSAIALSRTILLPYAEAKALYIYGLLHAARQAVEPAQERLIAAVTILHRLGERLYSSHVEQALTDLMRL
jgi:tetratricopeptide (TPR) repeat protein/transcriptional regulator with XRE-family HTH domain